MKYLDRVVRDLRIRQAVRRIPDDARILDVGCHDGALFRAVGARAAGGVGIEMKLEGPFEFGPYRLIAGRFPDDLPAEIGTFDVITALATFEHIPVEDQHQAVGSCWDHVQPGGRVILTVPAPVVDRILHVLVALRVIDGMSHEEHFGFEPQDLIPLFHSHGFRLAERRRFELGLNHVFVFTRPV